MNDGSPYAWTGKRSASWQLRTRRFQFGRRPLVMGILNVTPDSFSDGGRFAEHHLAVEHARRLVSEGADILDIGGESTRPYAVPASTDEEFERVIPVVEQVCRELPVAVSIDTSKATIARAALERGAEIINDITGLTADPKMVEVARQSRAGICAMHIQGTPQTMQDDPRYADVVQDVSRYLAARRDALLEAGIDRERICLDPGIGFGKTHQHNLTLLANCHRFHQLGCPLLVGHSRKGFVAKVLGDKQRDRAAGTLGVSLALALQGIQILRVHDVQVTQDGLRLFEAVGGLTGEATRLGDDW